MKYYIISDTHFGHKNIIKYCNRPFKNTKEMDYLLVKNWNNRVSDKDIVFHLGDFSYIGSKIFNKYWNQLNGKKILIRGNHDSKHSIIEEILIYYKKKTILLIHYPVSIPLKETNISLVLCGHVHNNWKYKIEENYVPIINMSVEVWNYTPISLDKIIKEYEHYKRK